MDFSLKVHGWIILIDLQISSYLGFIVERYEILVDFGEEIRKGREFRAEKRMVPFVIFFLNGSNLLRTWVSHKLALNCFCFQFVPLIFWDMNKADVTKCFRHN